MTDTERLNWMETQEGAGLLSDDAGSWAVTVNGVQNVVMDPPGDVQTTFFVEEHEWKPSVREAIDAAIEDERADAADDGFEG